MATPTPLLADVDATFPSDDSGPAPLPHPKPLSSYWLDAWDCPLSLHGRDAPLPPEVDVLIIGSGLTGINCLRHLVDLAVARRQRLSIAVVEARQFCSGATGRNGGHLVPSATLAFQSMSQAYSVDEAVRAVRLEERSVNETVQTIYANGWRDEVDLVEGWNVHFFQTQQEEAAERAELAAAVKAGCQVSDYRWIPKWQAEQNYGATNSRDALRIPGYNLYPRKLVTKLYQLAKQTAERYGIRVDLFTLTPVMEVENDLAGGWRAITSRGAIRADVVAHCTNGYASHLLPQYASGPRKISPTRGQVVAVRPSLSSKPNPIWTAGLSANEGFDYLFQRPPRPVDQGKQAIVIFGGGRNFAAPGFEFNVADDSRLNEDVSKHLRRFLPERFGGHWKPGTVDVEQEWSGIMAFTSNHDPLVGPVVDEDGRVLDGQFLSAGYSGHGVSRAPVCGEVLAQMIVAYREKRDFVAPDYFPQHYLSTR